MFVKKQSTRESESQGGRIKVGNLQRIPEAISELTPGEQKKVKGGIIIRIIGVLIGGRSAPADQRQQ